MKTVSLKDINIKEIIKRTSSSYVMSCLYNNHQYCYKEITIDDKELLYNIGKLTELEEKKGIILPRAVVLNNDNIEIGYISKLLLHNKTLEEISDKPLEEKISILKSARDRIETIHNEYGIIHGDLHTRNICVNKNNKSSIIDFDLCYNEEKLTAIARKYINKNGYDYDLDKYIFNCTTYAFLNNINFRDVIWAISNGYLGEFKTKESIKEVNKLAKIKRPNKYLIDLV